MKASDGGSLGRATQGKRVQEKKPAEGNAVKGQRAVGKNQCVKAREG